jgi:proteic killer suppression protein
MICTFKDKDTAAVFAHQFVKRFSGIEQTAYLRLKRLHAAEMLADLGAIPGNHLEALKRDRQGQHSIRINDQWRIVFRWVEGKGAHDVEIIDYH